MDPRPDRVLARKSDGLSVAQAARRTGLHPQTLYGYVRDGKIPVTRFGLGRVARIHPDDVDELLGPQADAK